jgi:hypothetical protein
MGRVREPGQAQGVVYDGRAATPRRPWQVMRPPEGARPWWHGSALRITDVVPPGKTVRQAAGITHGGRQYPWSMLPPGTTRAR